MFITTNEIMLVIVFNLSIHCMRGPRTSAIGRAVYIYYVAASELAPPKAPGVPPCAMPYRPYHKLLRCSHLRMEDFTQQAQNSRKKKQS